MYAAFFGLKQEPFSIAPDPRLLFMSERHREALAHLLYGLGGGGGFVLLTGEIGTGKTTVCRCFIEQVPAHCNLAYIFNPKLTVTELLETVCHEFGIALPLRDGTPTVKDCIDPLNAFLLRSHAAGRNNVLVIDEAQNLSADVLEQLRLLTNLETSERKLLQIVLVGQPQLREMLAQPELEQLAQRVIARYHLDALSAAETAQYVRHRLEVCGLQGPLPFDRRALKRVHALTGGVPRRVNLLCDRALLGAYAHGQGSVNGAILAQAGAEVFDRAKPVRPAWLKPALALGFGLAAGAGLFAAVSEVTRATAPRDEVPMASSLQLDPAPLRLAAALQPPLPPLRVEAPAPTLWRELGPAQRELAQAWGLNPGDAEPCDALEREQVHCFSRVMNLSLIRQLGRPGIVTLDAATGQPSYAILSALTDRSATLRAAGTEQTVTLNALAQRWQGEFATLWRAPAGYGGPLAEGSRGAMVDWLAEGLAVARGGQTPKRGATLGPALKSETRAFQLAQGLPVDGAAGPLTFMQLNRARGVDEPRLRMAD